MFPGGDLTPSSAQTETIAMHEIAQSLESLDPDARNRAWIWAGQRFGLIPMPVFNGPLPQPHQIAAIEDLPEDHPLHRLFGGPMRPGPVDPDGE